MLVLLDPRSRSLVEVYGHSMKSVAFLAMDARYKVVRIGLIHFQTVCCTRWPNLAIVFRLHCSTVYVDVVCCYRQSSMVCLSVCLLVGLSVCHDRDSWALQKPLNRSRCCLVCGLFWVQWSTYVLVGGAQWRHLANTTEPSMCGGNAAFLSNYFDHLFMFVILSYSTFSSIDARLHLLYCCTLVLSHEIKWEEHL